MSKKRKIGAPAHRAMMVSKQAERALHAFFYEEDAFPYLSLDSVQPEPGSSNLILNFRLARDPAPLLSVGEILRELRLLEGSMRAVVAREVHRKRVPGLRFRVLP